MVYKRVPETFKNSNIVVLYFKLLITWFFMTLLFTAINGAVTSVGSSIGLGSMSMLVAFVLFLVYLYYNLLFNTYFWSRLIGQLPKGDVTCTSS